MHQKASKLVLKHGLSFLNATHRHDLFYITMMYHQNTPNGTQVIEQTRKCLWMDVQMDGWTDKGQTPGSSLYPRTFRAGDKKEA